MKSSRKKVSIRIFVTLFLLILSFFIQSQNPTVNIVLLGLSYLIIGYDILLKSIKNITRGKIFDENFLMTVATIGAFAIQEYQEAVAVMLFYQIGELFQNYAVEKSRQSISSLMNIRPDYAHVYRGEKLVKVKPEEVKIGELILVKPSEKIPLDGIIIEGTSKINTMALTGESRPRTISKDDNVLNGCINIDRVLKIKVTKEFQESTVMKILELVENASNRKSSAENFISKFAKYYTPIIVFLALFLSIIPPIILKESFSSWLYRALSFLVVSCPCALVISIPLSFFSGIGYASKRGILIKGSNYLEALSHTEMVVCDKTGTLTEGNFKVQVIEPINQSSDELLEYVAYAEHHSLHPIALSIKEAYGKTITDQQIKDYQEVIGKGITCRVFNHPILVGNEKLMEEHTIEYPKNQNHGTVLYVAIDNLFVGTITIADKIKEDAYTLVSNLKKQGVKKVVMLTGDFNSISTEIAEKLHIDEYHAELLPQDKVAWVEKLLKLKSDQGKLIFLGDGINDAPVLALSDVGVAMGNIGSDAAVEASDIILMTDEPSKLIEAITISKKTMGIVKENILFAIGTKLIVLLLSAFGLATMWAAVFADVGVSVLAILNSFRILIQKGCDYEKDKITN